MKDFRWIIVDADSLLYQAALANQESYWLTTNGKRFDNLKTLEKYCANTGHTLQEHRVDAGELSDAYDHLSASLRDIYETLGEGTLLSYIGNTNRVFRDRIATRAPYKGNRDGTNRPLLLSGLKEKALEEGIVVEADDTFEADDLVVWAFTNLQELYGLDSVVLAGIDKDALQQPGYHWNYGTHELKEVTEDQASINFMTQMLVGDTVDNIRGLYGVGKKSVHVKRLKEMSSHQERFDSVRTQYEKHYNNYAIFFMKETFQLLRMCTRLDTAYPIAEFAHLWREDQRDNAS